MSESGLVFENSAEDMSVETEIAYRVAKALKPTAIFCTGTSRLSITTLTECYLANLRSRFWRTHV